MTACPACGAQNKATDKFCNACGTPLQRAAAPAPQAPPPQYANAPPPIDQMQFAQPAFPGAPQQQGYAQQGYPQQGYPPPGYPPQPPYPQHPQQAYAQPPHPQYPGYGTPAAPPDPYAQPQPPPVYQQQPYAPQAQPPAPAAPYQPPPHYAPPAQVQPVAEPVREAPPANALRGFLVSFQTNPAGDFWPLRGGKCALGRANSGESIEILLPDPTISSRHATIHVDVATGTVTVEDTNSTNGTYVNEDAIGTGGRRDLRDGDRVRFGGFTTMVKLLGRI